ncbi:MAG: phosphoribosylamine--glycine ligase [Phycisphaeraceae bacterium]|nr:phosphoribosylamine--glycine ligase [Phycisphaerae bacterium]MBX3391606.1 phosphoribosylamine--glycine ligase [Phycisphaeraceae bacterium]
MEKVNVLLIGGGGREHALALKLRESPRLGTLWVTHPENPGLADLGRAADVPVNIREVYRLEQFCDRQGIDLVVIGPEDPLAEGFADKLATERRLVFGPGSDGARIEADKGWCKQLLRSAAIPTGEARILSDAESALSYVESRLRDDEAVRVVLGPLREIRDPHERGRYILQRVKDNIGLVGERLSPEQATAVRARAVITCASIAASAFRDPEDRRRAMREFERTDPMVSSAYTARIPGLPVIKASGLARGKGVVLPSTMQEAARAIDEIMVRRIHGDAGSTVIIEERLSGPEVSVLAITDGTSIMVLPACQDHKRLLDGDRGPNTGGMGAFCPSGVMDADLMGRVEREILVPVVDALRREEIEYRGVLYAGLMLTASGPKVLEFNARFGDPECQPLMARLRTDLIDLMIATCRGELDRVTVEWDPRTACCVVLAAEGYPEKPRAGAVIEGLEEASRVEGVTIHHAGTRRDGGRIVVAGGRVLGVTALGETLDEARARAYRACDLIRYEGKTLRRDIGQPGVPGDRTGAGTPA